MDKLSYYSDPTKCYFITYHCIALNNLVDGVNDISNTIIRGKHPLVWVNDESENYRKYYITYISFWEEIPESLFEYMQKYQNQDRPDLIPLEDYKS